MKNLNLIIFIAFVLFAISCSKKKSPDPTPAVYPVTINSISPTSGSPDTVVTITGTNFSATAANNIVTFNGVQAYVNSATSTTIKAVVPSGAGTGPVSVAIGSSPAVNGPVFTYIAPVITISSISPTSGGYDTVVTITGTNFNSVTYNNIVKFNGVAAVVQSATATSLKVIVPRGAGTGPVSEATLALAAKTGPVFTYNLTTNIYFGGIDVYWKNGVETLFARTGQYATINGIFKSGTDLYYAGNDVGSSLHPNYWKNGVENTLPTINNQGGGESTYFVSGNDVYFGGADGYAPAYWKNGVETLLPYSSIGGEVNAMVVQGTDVYCAGIDGTQPVYWKNGTKYILPITGGNASITAMAIDGTDIYFGGSETGLAVYWKNGVEHILPLKNPYGTVSAIAVSGTDVYLGGSDGNYAAAIPVYWKNGAEYVLPSTNNIGAVYSMTISGTDIYYVGYELSTIDKPVYWKNGTEYFLSTNVLSGLMATSIYLDIQ